MNAPAKAHKAINFSCSKVESDLITKIVQRAEREFPEADVDRLTLTMDITAAHVNSYPLKLAELLIAKPFDFAHDVFGIRREIDRRDASLGCFLPRYADTTAQMIKEGKRKRGARA
jgi:hypothetical protein